MTSQIIFIIFLSILVIHMLIVKSRHKKDNSENQDKKNNIATLAMNQTYFYTMRTVLKGRAGKGLCVTLCSVLILLVQPFRFCFTEPGKVKVSHSKRLILNAEEEISICEGTMVYNQFTAGITTYPTALRTVRTGPYLITLKDGAAAHVDSVQLTYKVNPDRADLLYKEFRGDLNYIEDNYIRPYIQKELGRISDLSSLDSLSSYKPKIEMSIGEALHTGLSEKGMESYFFSFILTSVKKNNEARCYEERKDGSAIVRDSCNIIEKARMEAEAIRIRARAEAEYNKVIAPSLTPLVIQKMWIDKWDGNTMPAQHPISTGDSWRFE